MEKNQLQKNDNLLKDLRIMCVEDEPDAREALVSLLRRRARKVMGCENGRKGLESFECFMPDIIVADLLMPEMGGIEMIKEIRMKYPGANFKVLVLTAMNDTETIIRAVDAGIDKYVIKPVDMKDFLQAINEIAEKLTARRNSIRSISEEDRLLLQNEVRKCFAADIKRLSGRGPKEIKVFFGDETIEITAFEFMTTIERSIFNDKSNKNMIQYVREKFFSVNSDKFSESISDVIGLPVTMRTSVIDVEGDRIKLIFDIVRNQ